MSDLVRVEYSVGLDVAHILHLIDLVVRPSVHRNTLHFCDMCANLAVNAGTCYADEYTQIP